MMEIDGKQKQRKKRMPKNFWIFQDSCMRANKEVKRVLEAISIGRFQCLATVREPPTTKTATRRLKLNEFNQET